MINSTKYFFDISLPSVLKALTPDHYQILSVVFCVSLAFLLFLFRKKVVFWRLGIYYTVIVEYLFLLFYVTIIHRDTSDEARIILTPLWSYSVVGEMAPNVALEVMLNVLLHVPLGALLGLKKQVNLKKVLIISGFLSIVTEILQAILKRGFCETDDLIHNLTGAVIGYGFIKSLIILKNHITYGEIH